MKRKNIVKLILISGLLTGCSSTAASSSTAAASTETYKNMNLDAGIFDTTYAARNRFVERHKYFSMRAGDSDYYYWDFQKMRTQYGPDEMGTSAPIGMPATPHPWCAKSASDVANLVQYLLTL